MIKKLGYACINLHLKPKGFMACQKNSVYKYGIHYLRNKIINNLALTKEILEWNYENNILMYRITSNLLPLVDHPDIIKDFKWRWQDDREINEYMKDIKDLVKKRSIRLSIHPDQFIVLNSFNEKVVQNSIHSLQHHYEVLQRLGGLDMIIHVGGVYGDKKASMERFIVNYYTLDKPLQKTLRLENDDTSYNLQDVLYIHNKTAIPIVLDIHHHRCNHIKPLDNEDILQIQNTWKETGLIPKMHLSSGRTSPTDRKHSDYIQYTDLQDVIKIIDNIDIDLMIEAKMKDKAVLKLHEWCEE